MSEAASRPRLLARVRGPESDLAIAVTDAACWVAALRRAGAAGDTVGTFRGPSSVAEADAVVEAARRVLSAAERGTGDTGWLLDLDGRSVDVSHGVAVYEGLDAAVDPLIARALASPVAAVRLEAHVVEVPGMGAMLGFTFASLGEEPSSLLLDPDRFAVVLDDASVVALPAPTLGLVDGDGSLRDGLRAIAELPPGRRATCSFPAAALDDGDLERIASAAASGSIELTGPWAADGGQAFTVRAAAQAVPKGTLG